MKNDISIRPAEAGDMAAVEAMQRAVFGGEQDIPPELLPPPEGARWWCAVSPEGELLGTAAAWTEGGETHWGRFAVDPGLRGRGLGTRLARASLDDLFASGTETVHAEAREATVRILCRLGARVTGEPVPFYRGTVTPVALTRAAYHG